jgi:DNA-binding NarL/FixJ family response regulator
VTAHSLDDTDRSVDTAVIVREIEIARLVMQGFKNREIAQKLSISEGTVKIHLPNVYEKLGIDGRLDLLLYMQEKGIKNS